MLGSLAVDLLLPAEVGLTSTKIGFPSAKVELPSLFVSMKSLCVGFSLLPSAVLGPPPTAAFGVL